METKSRPVLPLSPILRSRQPPPLTAMGLTPKVRLTAAPAVAGALRTIVVAVVDTIVAPAGMPVPATVMPAARPLVLVMLTVVLPLTVVP